MIGAANGNRVPSRVSNVGSRPGAEERRLAQMVDTSDGGS
jgi:hypothetical protein